jgi:hypothetical protein
LKVKENFSFRRMRIKARFTFRVNLEFSRMYAAFSTRGTMSGVAAGKKSLSLSLSLSLSQINFRLAPALPSFRAKRVRLFSDPTRRVICLMHDCPRISRRAAVQDSRSFVRILDNQVIRGESRIYPRSISLLHG